MAGPEGVQAAETGTEKKKHHHHHHHHKHHHKHHHHHRREEGAAEQTQTPVEKPIQTRSRRGGVREKDRPNLEVISNPEWYLGLKERMGQFMEYQNRFGFTRESLLHIVDTAKLDEIQVAADNKKMFLDALNEGVERQHDAMLQDPGNEEKKAEGQELYENCKSKKDVCERMYVELSEAIQYRKDYIKEHPKEAEKIAKRTKISERLQNISKDSPVMQLIRRVKGMKEGNADASGIESTALKDLNDIVGDGMQDVYEQINEAAEMKDNVQETAEQTQEFIEGILGKGEDGGKDDRVGKVTGVVDSVKEIIELIYGVVEFVKNRKKMSKANESERLASLIKDGINAALNLGTTIIDFIKEIPILGGIVGLIKNVVNFFHNGYTLYTSNKRIAALREQKNKLKEKMLKRKKKYAEDPELAHLYSYVEEGESGRAHVRKKGDNAVGAREIRGVQDADAGGRNKKTMAAASSEKKGAKKKEYYEAKEAESLQQYDEMKEAVHRNKNVNRDAILNLVEEGIDVAGNIASFIPGAGTLVAQGAALAKSGMGWVRKGASSFQEKHREKKGHKRSTTNKKKFRGKYAQHVYSCLEDVAELVNSQGEFTINLDEPDKVKRAEDSYNYVSGLLEGVGADMPKLINAENQEALLDALSSMFGREG